MNRVFEYAIFILAGLLGIGGFVYPFLLPEVQQSDPVAAAAGLVVPINAPLLAMILISASLLVLVIEAQGRALNAKVVASLGALIAFAAALRFLENAIPGPGGFSPVFVPIILAGYVFGARFGVLMGSISILASALITGGLGPWLPYQMTVAAWIGLSAGWLPRVTKPSNERLIVAGFAALWGFLFGFVLNLYFWPFVTGEQAYSWQPGIGLTQAVTRYLAFYVGTSLVWDLMRAAGNLVLILLLGAPMIKALYRFKLRFNYELA